MERVRLNKRRSRRTKPLVYLPREEFRRQRQRRRMQRLGIRHDEQVPADAEFIANLAELCRAVERHQASRCRMSSYLVRISRFQEE